MQQRRVTSPRWTKACSYADHFPTRYFVLYFGWTFDLMSRSCTRSGHRGQRAYSCLVAAEGLCTNACEMSKVRRTGISTAPVGCSCLRLGVRRGRFRSADPHPVWMIDGDPPDPKEQRCFPMDGP